MLYIFIVIALAAVGFALGAVLRGAIGKGTAAMIISIAAAVILACGMTKLVDTWEEMNISSDTEPVDAAVTEQSAYPDSTDTAEADTERTESSIGETTTDWDTAAQESEDESAADTGTDSDVTSSETTAQKITETTGETTAAVTTHVEWISEVVTHRVTEPPHIDTLASEPVTTDVGTEPLETSETTAPEPEPDYAAMAQEAYTTIVKDAAAYIQASPKGKSFESFPFEREDVYSPLTEEQKGYYDELLAAVTEQETRVWRTADGHVLDDIRAAAEALAVTRPDMQCYFTIVDVTEGERVTAVEIRYFLPGDGTDVTYTDKSQIASEMAYFEAVCDFIVESMPEGITTYDKYRYFASVVSLITIYDHNYELPHNNASAYGGIVSGLTICKGYSIAFEYLCEKADLYCGRVEGKSFNNNIHMWNLVKLDTGTYHVDVTWSDSGSNKPCDSRWMKYFMITQEKLLTDHIISDGTVATGK